jgi:hypothetical protein
MLLLFHDPFLANEKSRERLIRVRSSFSGDLPTSSKHLGASIFFLSGV